MEYSYYNSFASDYHLKRKKAWIPLIHFLDKLDKKGYRFYGICLDLGCGNGRNFKIFKSFFNNKLIGIDNSLEFLKIAKTRIKNSNLFTKNEQNYIQLILADLIYLPIRNNSIQNVFSIATIHHIKTKLQRENVINQIFNILKLKGYFLCTNWRRWQKKYRKFFIKDWIQRFLISSYFKDQKKRGLKEFGDKFVPWTVSSKNKTYNRFYHFFSKREIKELLKIFIIKEFHYLGGSSNKDNFFILSQKS